MKAFLPSPIHRLSFLFAVGWLLALAAAVPVSSNAVIERPGDEFRVNDATAGVQGEPRLAGAPNGNFAVVWESQPSDGEEDCFLRLYDPAGTPQTSDVQINTYTTGEQRNPAVAAHPNGFVVVWESRNQVSDSSSLDIYARLYNSAGEPQSDEIPVNESTADQQKYADVGVDPSTGNFVVVWQSPTNGGFDVYVRRFDAEGKPLGREEKAFIIGDTRAEPAVAVDAAGNFIIACEGTVSALDLVPGPSGDSGQVPLYPSQALSPRALPELSESSAETGYDIILRRFDSTGASHEGCVRANTATGGDQSDPDIAADPNGNFVVVWESDQTGDVQVFARRYDFTGIPQGDEFQVNSTSEGNYPRVAMHSSGSFLVVWESPDGDKDGVFARRFDSTGSAMAADYRVNSVTAGEQCVPDVAFQTGQDPAWLAGWESVPPDGFSDVIAQKFVEITPTPTPGPFRIQAFLPLTGAVENFGTQVHRGLTLAGQDRSSAGGTQFDLQVHDNGSSLQKAKDSVQAASDDPDTVSMISGVISAHALEMGLLAKDAGLPLFTPTATSHQLASSDYNAFNIRVAPLDNYQVEAIKYFLTSFGVQRVVLLNEDSPYGDGFYQGLSSDASINLLGHYAFPYGNIGLDAAVNAIQGAVDKGARIGVLAAYDQDANALLKRLADVDGLKNFDWIMTDGATLETTLKGLPAQGLFYQPRLYGLTPSITPDLYTSQQFMANFQAQFSEKPEWFAYYGYDSFMACAAAFDQAAEKTPSGIWNAIPNLQFEGATGRKWFDDKGMLQSAVYDIKKVVAGEFVILGEVRVKQPGTTPGGNTSGKMASTKAAIPSGVDSDLVFQGFTYTLPGADEKIGHVAGGPGENGTWLARSRDYDEGWVLVAFYEDAVRGTTDDNRRFGFREGLTYHLNFDMSRQTVDGKTPAGENILEVKVTSVCRYRDAEGVQRFAMKDLVQKTATFTKWPEEGSLLFDIPVEYASAAPDGVVYADEDQMLNWEITLFNSAHQELTFKSVSIVQQDITAVEEFTLY